MPAFHGHVLITGASSGIGKALALAYAESGRRLSLGGRDEARLAEVAAACRERGATVHAALVDVRDETATRDWVLSRDDDTPLDLVIAGAGITTGLGPGRVVETPESVKAIFAVNLHGVLNTVQPILPRFVERRAGRVALVGSLAGYRAIPQSPAYCATKAAVHLWAEGLRGGLEPHGVGVSLIAPGFVATPLNEDMIAPRPGQIDAATAARIIRRGLDRGRPVIAFPWINAFGMRLIALLPPRHVDWVMRRLEVDVPETRERAR